MGCGASKPEVKEESKPVVQPVQIVQPSPEPPQASSPPGDAINILPAGGPAPVAILPPWVNHTELEVGRRPSSMSNSGTPPANDQAANALRSNLSEVCSEAQTLIEFVNWAFERHGRYVWGPSGRSCGSKGCISAGDQRWQNIAS